MNKLAVSLLAGAAALVVGSSVQAAPLSPVAPALDSNIQNVRMVCNEFGRCWRERGSRRVIIERDSYNYYEPRYRHHRRHYHHSGPGVHFNAPGVSIGIGGGHHRW